MGYDYELKHLDALLILIIDLLWNVQKNLKDMSTYHEDGTGGGSYKDTVI